MWKQFSSVVRPLRHNLSVRHFVVFAGVFGLYSAATAQPTLEWTRQFGTSGYDEANGVVTDGFGNSYVVGTTLET